MTATAYRTTSTPTATDLTPTQKRLLSRRCSDLWGKLLHGEGTRIGRQYGHLFNALCCARLYPAMQIALDAWDALPDDKRQEALDDARYRSERRREDYKLSLMGPVDKLRECFTEQALTQQERNKLLAIRAKAIRGEREAA